MTIETRGKTLIQAQSSASKKTRAGITTTLALAMLLASLGTSIANIALPALAEAFSASFPQVQAVVVAYLGTMTISVVIAGRAGDRFGLKAMLIMGLTLFIAASLLSAAASSLWLLIGARALQGIGAAFLMTFAMALMRHTVDEAHIGRAMGLLGTVSALGTALGPSLGGLLIQMEGQMGGWRSIFWVQVPLAVFALILTILILPGEQGAGNTTSTSLWSVLDRRLTPSLLINILVAAVMMTTLVVGPFYLSLGLGLTATETGLAMAIGPVISIFSGLPSGRLVDAWGSRPVLAVGLGLLALGAFLLAFLPNTIGVPGYILSLIVLTPGYQLFQAANNTAAFEHVLASHRGTVSGLLGLSRNIGLIAGASIMGAIFAFGVGTEDFAHADASSITSGMRLTFLTASALIIVAIALVLSQPDTKAKNRLHQ
ncbi:MFS transporter [Nitratireductor indicus]